MCHTTVGDTENEYSKWKCVAHKPAGSPHFRASQDLLPGAPTKRGASYQSYLERPTNPTSRRGGGGVHTYKPKHTHLDYKTTENQAQAGIPNNGNSTVETPADRGERVKRSPNEIRAYMDDPAVLPSFLQSFLASFSTSSTAPVGRTPTGRH